MAWQITLKKKNHVRDHSLLMTGVAKNLGKSKEKSKKLMYLTFAGGRKVKHGR